LDGERQLSATQPISDREGRYRGGGGGGDGNGNLSLDSGSNDVLLLDSGCQLSATQPIGDGGGGGQGECGDDVGRMCARWRAAAGKPGATVMREVQAMLNPGATTAAAAAADCVPTVYPCTSAASAAVDNDSEEWRGLGRCTCTGFNI